MRKKRRKAGPSSPVAGIVSDIEQANHDRAQPDAIPQLLAALRRGDKGASEALVKAFRWMVYEFTDQHTEDFDYDKLSTMFLGLTVAIERLANNDQADAEKFIRDELVRSCNDFYREETPDLLPPHSTIWNQEDRGETPYKPLRCVDAEVSPRSDNGDDDVAEYNQIESPKREIPLSTAKSVMDISDLRVDLTKTPQEEAVFNMLLDGYSVPQISVTLSTTRHRVETIIKKFETRARLAGYDDFETVLQESA